MKTSDSSETIFKLRPEGLARILALDEAAADVWAPEEMQAIWQHQLSAPIELDLSTVESARSMKKSPELASFLALRFGELLGHSQPPVELLRLTKEFAKQTLKDSEDAQLKDVATALYCASYAAGMTRCQTRIGGLDDEELDRAFQWALNRPWLDEGTKKLIADARRLLPSR